MCSVLVVRRHVLARSCHFKLRRIVPFVPPIGLERQLYKLHRSVLVLCYPTAPKFSSLSISLAEDIVRALDGMLVYYHGA
eukprot:2631643-Amphidinium_carterae.1